MISYGISRLLLTTRCTNRKPNSRKNARIFELLSCNHVFRKMRLELKKGSGSMDASAGVGRGFAVVFSLSSHCGSSSHHKLLSGLVSFVGVPLHVRLPATNPRVVVQSTCPRRRRAHLINLLVQKQLLCP